MLLSKTSKNLAIKLAKEKIQSNLFASNGKYSFLGLQYKMFASKFKFNSFFL